MTRPAEIPEDVWGAACDCWETLASSSPLRDHETVVIARAINAERERCAVIADAYAEVNWQSVTDSILLDPVLSNKGERPLTRADWAKAEGMAVDGTIHSSMYHAATNIAAAIRNSTPAGA